MNNEGSNFDMKEHGCSVLLDADAANDIFKDMADGSVGVSTLEDRVLLFQKAGGKVIVSSLTPYAAGIVIGNLQKNLRRVS